MQLGSEHGGLYFADCVTPPLLTNKPVVLSSSSCNQSSSVLSTCDLWHCRLGHMSFDNMKHIECIPHKQSKTTSVCQICPQAKHHRSSFPVSIFHSSHLFQLLHVDIWGPYPLATYNGFQYFLTIVDEYSRATWTHLLSHKSNAFPILQSFITFISTQFGAHVKTIRSDNGAEFCDRVALAFYASKGIFHQTSCVARPQQNGVVERKHKHLLETARALHFQSNLPLKLWGEGLLTATYLINLMPSTVLHHKTPHEFLYNHKPQYNYLRTFGCLCFVPTQSHQRTKFPPRSHPCIFLGYPHGKKGYKVYDLVSHKVYSSTDVVFHEHIFPYHHIKSSNPDPLPHPLFFSHSYSSPEPYIPQTSSPSNTVNSHSIHTSSPSSSLSPSSPSHSSPSTSDSSFQDSNIVPASPPPPPLIRRSNRPHQPPEYLSDYVCHTATAPPSHWCNFVSFNVLPSQFQSHINNLTTYTEPTSYTQASLDPNWVRQ